MARETAQELQPNRILQGLTHMQEAYCQARANGAKAIDAYRAAYNSENAKPDTISRRAAELEIDGRIVARVRQIMEANLPESTLAPRLTKEFVLSGVMQLALTADKDSTRLRAYELLGKTIGIDLFRETINTTDKQERSIEDIDRELKEKLVALKPVVDLAANERDTKSSNNTVIDGHASAVPSAPPDRRRKPAG